MRMENKVVIITGGGRSIGFGIAKAFAKEGAKVVITGRTEQTLLNAAEELRKNYGAEVLPLVCDNKDEASIQKTIDKVVSTYGRIDALINNAQTIIANKPMEDYTLEQFATNFTTGIFAMFLYIKYALPYLKESKGSVVCFASGSGMNGQKDYASYNASKEAVRGLVRSVANEYGPFGINVNAVCPIVETEGMKEWEKTYPERYQAVLETIPMRRFGDAEKDIGRVCLFLCSEDAKFITGESIGIDGGCVLRP